MLSHFFKVAYMICKLINVYIFIPYIVVYGFSDVVNLLSH